MDFALLAMAEDLAAEFPSLPNETVVWVLTDCVAEFPDADVVFVEEAARARLSAHDRSRPMSHGGRLDVDLNDPELKSEIEMTAELMIAASESDVPLDQEAIDRLLGLRP